MIRWLIGHPGPHFSVHDVYEGWVEALRGLGEEVMEFNLGDRLSFYDAAYIEAGEPDAEGRAVRKAMTREAIETAADGIFRLYGNAGRTSCCWSAFFTPPWMLEVLSRPRPQDRDAAHRVALPGQYAAEDGGVGERHC